MSEHLVLEVADMLLVSDGTISVEGGGGHIFWTWKRRRAEGSDRRYKRLCNGGDLTKYGVRLNNDKAVRRVCNVWRGRCKGVGV